MVIFLFIQKIENLRGFSVLSRLNFAIYVLKNRKVEIINPLRNKPNTAKTKKHPLKVKNLEIKKHHFLRISVIFDVMFWFCPKSPF